MQRSFKTALILMLAAVLSVSISSFSCSSAAETEPVEDVLQLIMRMPDIATAYREMGARLHESESLRDRGIAGEGNKGLLVEMKEGLSAADRVTLDADNASRKRVIRGMSKAILRLRGMQENEENIREVTPLAESLFSAIRRDAAKRGWWIQDDRGGWTRR